MLLRPCKAMPSQAMCRELEHLIERAAVKAGGRAITAEQIQERIDQGEAPRIGRIRHPDSGPDAVSHGGRKLERHLIEQASNGNKSDAARQLEIHRRLLYEKLAQSGYARTGMTMAPRSSSFFPLP